MKFNNSANRPKLAQDMVDSWDLKDMQYFATSKMEDYLVTLSDEEFDEKWRDFYVDYHLCKPTGCDYGIGG